MKIARTLVGSLRTVDVVGRLGGGEFALLLPATDSLGARTVLDRLQDRLAAECVEQGIRTTVSIGCLTMLEPPPSIEELMTRVDALMYEVKRSGKGGLRLGGADDGLESSAE